MSETSSIPHQIQEQLRKYYPGTVVPLAPIPADLTLETLPKEFPLLRVFPVRFTKIGKYSEAIAAIVLKLDLTQVKVDAASGGLTLESYTYLITKLAKIVIADLMDLVDECCIPSLKEVDPYHDVIPLVVEAWIKENFLGERLNPWKRPMEDLYHRVTGQKLSLSAELFKSLSDAVTQRMTSSGNANPVSPTTDGVMSNSGAT